MIYLCLYTYLGLSTLATLFIWSFCVVAARTDRAMSADQFMERRHEPLLGDAEPQPEGPP